MDRSRIVRVAIGIYATSVFARGIAETTRGGSPFGWVSLLIGAGLFAVVLFRYDDSMKQMERTPYFELIVGSALLFAAGTVLGVL
ncbi:hypothetical protein [Haloprofundus halobius]|uniref:hypothetical protein n=1 Tax=Haloprofundus halobius TaxID=2876194 RepID=UPI001CCFC7AF|nr:hypothetical protein [Haloprofundus halobius]